MKLLYVYDNMKNLSQEELIEIYDRLNKYEWDDRLGDKPEGWGQMPENHRHWYHRILRRRTKLDCIIPIMNYIKNRVGQKEVYRYHHLNNLHSTDEEFEKWWEERNENRWD